MEEPQLQDAAEPAAQAAQTSTQNEQDRQVLKILHGILDAVQNPEKKEEEPLVNKYVSKKNFLSSIISYTAPENILTADMDLASKVCNEQADMYVNYLQATFTVSVVALLHT